jgi:hypothetical protein
VFRRDQFYRQQALRLRPQFSSVSPIAHIALRDQKPLRAVFSFHDPLIHLFFVIVNPARGFLREQDWRIQSSTRKLSNRRAASSNPPCRLQSAQAAEVLHAP